MGHKTTAGNPLTHPTIVATRPSGDDGVDLADLPGHSRADRWLVTTTFDHESARASLNLATVVAAITTVIRARSAYFGIEGNGVRVQAVADSISGVVVTDDISTLEVTIHFQPGVSTVAQMEAAIAADSDIIEVLTPGAVHTLVGGNAFAFTSLAGGTDNATTTDIFIWGRDVTSKMWGLHNDPYGRVLGGLLMNDAIVGRQHIYLRDIGNYDRIAFTRTAGSGTLTAVVTEILSSARGN